VDDQIWRRGPDKAGEQDRKPRAAAKETEQHRTLGRREDGREESHGERFGSADGRRGADLPEAILNHGASVRANAAVTIRKRVPAGPTSKTDHRRKVVVARTIESPSTRGMDQESSTDTGSRRPIPHRARSKVPAARPADHAAPRAILPQFCDEMLAPTRLPCCHRIRGATDSSAEKSTRPLALGRWV
jgi:hypothetical protein